MCEITIFLSFISLILLWYIHLTSGKCPKHEALLHNFKPMYFLDKGETIEVWAKVIPEPWEDNRLIGSLSNTEYLTFNLTSWETSEKQGIGVISRAVRAAIRQKDKQTANKKRLAAPTGDVLFTIKGFSEDTSCVTLKAETNVTVGCPVSRRIFPRGKPVSCNGFVNHSFVIPRNQRKELFLEGGEVSDQLIEYDFDKLGCPLTVLKSEPFKPGIDLYDGEKFVKEVDANHVLWEQHGRAGFTYSATMEEVGCVIEAQNWEILVKSMQELDKEAAWSKENYRSCFESPANGSASMVNLNQPYEILNSSAASSHVIWHDVGMFVFTVKVIDPEFSFCNLTVEFAVQVIVERSLVQEIPSFVVLGSSCLIIIAVVVSAYYISVFCAACSTKKRL